MYPSFIQHGQCLSWITSVAACPPRCLCQRALFSPPGCEINAVDVVVGRRARVAGSFSAAPIITKRIFKVPRFSGALRRVQLPFRCGLFQQPGLALCSFCVGLHTPCRTPDCSGTRLHGFVATRRPCWKAACCRCMMRCSRRFRGRQEWKWLGVLNQLRLKPLPLQQLCASQLLL